MKKNYSFEKCKIYLVVFYFSLSSKCVLSQNADNTTRLELQYGLQHFYFHDKFHIAHHPFEGMTASNYSLDLTSNVFTQLSYKLDKNWRAGVGFKTYLNYLSYREDVYIGLVLRKELRQWNVFFSYDGINSKNKKFSLRPTFGFIYEGYYRTNISESSEPGRRFSTIDNVISSFGQMAGVEWVYRFHKRFQISLHTDINYMFTGGKADESRAKDGRYAVPEGFEFNKWRTSLGLTLGYRFLKK